VRLFKTAFGTQNQAADKYAELQKRIEASIESQNRLLERQLDILNRLEGAEWFSVANATVESLDESLEKVMSDLRALTVRIRDFTITYATGTNLDTLKYTIEQFKDIYAKGSYSEVAPVNRKGLMYWFDEKALKDLIDQYDALIEAKTDLENAFREKATGVTFDSIVDDIVDMFAQGKMAAADFADNFEELMKKAVSNSFEELFLRKQMQSFYEEFAGLAEDGLTGDEADALRAMYDQLIAGAREYWDQITAAFPDLFSPITSTSDPNSLVGAIRRELTEETGGILAGLFRTIQLDTREMLFVQQTMVDHLSGIEENTRYNRHLEQISNDISQLKSAMTS